MPGFIKTLVVLAVLAALAYFVFFVPLGDKTFFRHVVGISKTDEAEELKEELSRKAGDLKDDVVSRLPQAKPPEGGRKGEGTGTGQAAPGRPAGGAPLSDQSDADRRALEKVIERAGGGREKK